MENNGIIDKKALEKFETNEEKEDYILTIASSLIESENLPALLTLLTSLDTIWKEISTARLTKIIKLVLSKINAEQRAFEDIHTLLKCLIDWSSDKKMLKLDLECKLINLYLSAGKYKESLEKIETVSKELKKYDDKKNMILLYVYESRAYYELQDFSKAKSSLTAARALAVSSACPAQLQAQIDLLNGIYLSDELSFDTSISYFIESLEGFLQDKQVENAKIALRYMILNKILCSRYDDIPVVLSSKMASPLKDDQFIVLLCAISKVCKKRDLNSYNDLLVNNKSLVESDAYIMRHLNYLYNILLDKNILKIIEPYSHIKIEFISKKLGLEGGVVEGKLRKMILDKTIKGILDHDTQCLVLYDFNEPVESFALKNVKALKEFFSLIK